MNVIWVENVATLVFMEGEPVVGGRAELSIFYSTFSEYDDPKYSLTPSQKQEEKTEVYSYTVISEKAEIVSTRIDLLPRDDRPYVGDGRTYVEVGEPFKFIVRFDKPPAGLQLINFSWCDSTGFSFGPFGKVLVCEKMPIDPVYEFEREGAIATFNFPEGVSEPPDASSDRFYFSIVWAGAISYGSIPVRRLWWKHDGEKILIW